MCRRRLEHVVMHSQAMNLRHETAHEGGLGRQLPVIFDRAVEDFDASFFRPG